MQLFQYVLDMHIDQRFATKIKSWSVKVWVMGIQDEKSETSFVKNYKNLGKSSYFIFSSLNSKMMTTLATITEILFLNT